VRRPLVGGDMNTEYKECWGNKRNTRETRNTGNALCCLQAPARNFQDLLVWQKAHALVLGIYSTTARFPKHETFGLCSQMQRAAVSVPANIAEVLNAEGERTKLVS
jgi:23S rRNA-intervening sequence protein